MKEFKQDKHLTVCGTVAEWKELKKKFEGDQKVSVFDLRTVNESGGEKLPDIPEGWNYQRLPLTGATISEQDVDVFRREQRRNGKLLVVAPNEARGGLLALADQCRVARSELSGSDVDSLSGAADEKELRTWLKDYLERHQTTDVVGQY